MSAFHNSACVLSECVCLYANMSWTAPLLIYCNMFKMQPFSPLLFTFSLLSLVNIEPQQLQEINWLPF